MPSPDVSQYLDLTLYDRQPVEIYDDAVSYARTALPEWTPITGTVEDAILQAVSLMTGELAGAINRLTSGTVEAMVKLFGIERNTGTAATGTILVEVIDDLGYTIPAETRFGYLDNAGTADPVLYTFDTVEELIIPPGQTSGTVGVAGTVDDQYPTLPQDTILQLLTALAFVNSATLTAPLNPGSEPETEAAFLTRAVGVLNSYSSGLVLPDQIQQYVLAAYSDVFRCKVYSRVNPSADAWLDALANGYVTVYVARSGGQLVPLPTRNEIQADVTGRTVAGLSVGVTAARIVPIDVAITVTQKVGYTQSQVIANVESAIAQYLHPDYWDFSRTLYQNEVIALVDQVPGVDRVVSVSMIAPSGGTSGSGDLDFTLRGSLPDATTTVTVQA